MAQAPMTTAVGDEDPLSPTVMIHRYLASQGLQPTSQNVHNVTMANAMGMPVIPGLVNNEPPSDPGVGRGGGSVARKIEGNKGPIQDQSNTTMTESEKAAAGTANKDTSAQPGPNMNIGQMIMDNILPMLGAGAGVGAKYLWDRGRGSMPTPGGDVSPPPDVAPPTGDQYRLSGPEPQLALTGPDGQPRIGGPEAPTALEGPMQKAIAGPEPQLRLPAPPQQALPAPPPQLQGPQAPPGPPPASAAPDTIPMPAPEARIPLRPGLKPPMPASPGGGILDAARLFGRFGRYIH